ncbi:MAG TPA: polysaccharide biosynthesis tyrosine autokinase [Ignavibacteria bacterium]|nr:polysaccharide biosynthesis tyrosine autokinase [Ignavibacteria bacterium]HMQ99177.1 polysaccharide biosynthesis tyrosine autokinase [Ignavibacteria bacterium]
MESQSNSKQFNTIDSNIKSSHSIRFYFNLILRNKVPILLSLAVGLIVSYFYAYSQVDIYASASSMRLSKPKENVLENKIFSDIEGELPERYINNEVEILKSFAIREKTANSLLDSFQVLKGKMQFYLLVVNPENPIEPKSKNQIANVLQTVTEISQKRGLDIVSIKTESPSPQEAALISNCYAEAYADYSLKFNRGHLTLNREFLEKQVQEKYNSLLQTEDKLTNFLRTENVVELNAQANSIINQLSGIEGSYNGALIDLQSTSKALTDIKTELDKFDPRSTDYYESKITDPYISELQTQIAKLEITRDLAKTGNEEYLKNNKSLIETNNKIAELKKSLDEKLNVLMDGAKSNTPEELRSLSNKYFETKVLNNQNKIKEGLLKGYLNKYQEKFNKLPAQSIEYANLERERMANEKVYLMLLEKYQEALINEESQPNNVKIIDYGKVPKAPSKPNRFLIITIGLLIGLGLGYGFALLRNILDVSVKSPEDLENIGISLIGWVPTFMREPKAGRHTHTEQELVLAYNSDSVPAEAFRTLRTRLQFSKLEPEPIKTILITSSIPREGKTIISSNLAASFALSSRVLLLDCDFRKPRMHNIFNMKRYPGLCDYLFGTVPIEEAVRETSFPNLHIMTCGTIPTNPAELIASKHMQTFLNMMKPKYDYILIDSPPLATVTDAELLSSYVDGTVVVSLASKTRLDLLVNTIDTLNKINDTFIGVILNNFDYQATYGSYYKYYYYYYGSEKGKESASGTNGKSTNGVSQNGSQKEKIIKPN